MWQAFEREGEGNGDERGPHVSLIRARDHARVRREEGNACKESKPLFSSSRLLIKKNNKNNAIVND